MTKWPRESLVGLNITQRTMDNQGMLGREVESLTYELFHFSQQSPVAQAHKLGENHLKVIGKKGTDPREGSIGHRGR